MVYHVAGHPAARRAMHFIYFIAPLGWNCNWQQTVILSSHTPQTIWPPQPLIYSFINSFSNATRLGSSILNLFLYVFHCSISAAPSVSPPPPSSCSWSWGGGGGETWLASELNSKRNGEKEETLWSCAALCRWRVTAQCSVGQSVLWSVVQVKSDCTV